MYLIDKTKDFTTVELGKILKQFQTYDLPKYVKNWDYYCGKQDILNKVARKTDGSIDTTKKYNHIIVNYCYNIVHNFLGYMTGIPIQYENDNFDEIIDILKWNDYTNEDSELLRQALIFGRSFEICYLDEDGKQRFRTLDTRQCIPVYDNTLNNELQYVIRFWAEEIADKDTTNYIVEVYGPDRITTYKSSPGFLSFELISDEPHYYGQCPVTVFSLNKDEVSIFSQIMTLQDGYNDVLSGSVDDFDAFADAYLVLKGLQADEDDLASMKQNRVLIMDADCDANYLTKDINDTQTLNLITNLKDNIHKISNSPDMQDEKFMAQSGVAIRYKLVGFENTASTIECNMRKALQRRIELLSSILRLTDTEKVWRDCNIKFTRNLPTDLSDTVSTINQLRGLVSDRTLLTQVPFITDVDKEIKLLDEQQQKNMELYSYQNDTNIGNNDNELLTD